MMSHFKKRMRSAYMEPPPNVDQELPEGEHQILSLCRKVVDENTLNSSSYQCIVLEIYRLCGDALESVDTKNSIVEVNLDNVESQVMIDLTESDEDEVEDVKPQVIDVASRSQETENVSKLNYQGFEFSSFGERESCVDVIDECDNRIDIVVVKEEKLIGLEIENLVNKKKDVDLMPKVQSPLICVEKSNSPSSETEKFVDVNPDEKSEVENLKNEDDEKKSEKECPTSSSTVGSRNFNNPVCTNPENKPDDDFTQDVSCSWSEVDKVQFDSLLLHDVDDAKLEKFRNLSTDSEILHTSLNSTPNTLADITSISDDCISIFADEDEIGDLFQAVEFDGEELVSAKKKQNCGIVTNDSTTTSIDSDGFVENVDNNNSKKLETNGNKRRRMRLNEKNECEIDQTFNLTLTPKKFWSRRLSSSSDEEIKKYGKRRRMSTENGNKQSRRLADEFDTQIEVEESDLIKKSEGKCWEISDDNLDDVELGKKFEKLKRVKSWGFDFQKKMSGSSEDDGLEGLTSV